MMDDGEFAALNGGMHYFERSAKDAWLSGDEDAWHAALDSALDRWFEEGHPDTLQGWEVQVFFLDEMARVLTAGV